MSQGRPSRHSPTKRREKQIWLPAILALGGALLVFLALSLLQGKPASNATEEVTGAPSLKVDREKVDLGDMKFNQMAEVTFQLTNVGDQTLRFTKDAYVEVVEGC